MQRMLKIGGGNDHGIDVSAIVKLLVVARLGDFVPDQFTEAFGSFIATPAPDV